MNAAALIDYLDQGLMSAEVKALDDANLARLESLLYHWHGVTQSLIRDRAKANRDEASE